MKKKILVVAPHSDDAELGCGGMLSLYASRGHAVTVLLLSASSYTDIRGKRVFGYERVSEQVEGLRTLSRHIRLDVQAVAETNEFHREQTRIVGVLDGALRGKHCPDILVMPLPSYHQDHRVVHDACLAALRPTRGSGGPGNVLMYEYPGQDFSGPSSYDTGYVYVPFGKRELLLKIAALRKHKSQAVSSRDGVFGYNAARVLAQWRGTQCNSPYAEMFRLFRGVLCP